MRALSLTALCALALAAAPVRAGTTTAVTFGFDTEGEVIAPDHRVWTDAESGLTIRVMRPGAPVAVMDVSAWAPDWGAGSLSPFWDPANPAPFIVMFENVPTGFGVQEVAWEMGDNGGSDDDAWFVSTLCPEAASPSFTTKTEVIPDSGTRGEIQVTAASVRRGAPIVMWGFSGGSTDYPMSMFLDHFVVTLAPLTEFSGSDEPESDAGGDGKLGVVSSDGGAGGPDDPFATLAALIDSMNLASGTETSLLAKLDDAADKYAEEKYSAAIGKMGAFVNEVSAQSGKKLTKAQADSLLAVAATIAYPAKDAKPTYSFD